MTKNAAFKKAVRAHAHEHGMSYNESRRALLGPAVVETDPVLDALRPGTVTGVVCSGGLCNLALVLSSLIALQDRGHRLVLAVHRRGNSRHPAAEHPSVCDFMTGRGLRTSNEIADLLINMNRAEFEAVLSAMPSASVSAGQHPDEKWEEWLSADPGVTAPVLWVNDIQVAAPLIRDAESEFAGIGAQMSGLRALARSTGAIVAVGHCASAGEMEDWDAVLQGSDTTFAIEFADEELFSQQRPRRATVEHHSSDGPAYTFERVIDTRFADWRSMMLRSE